jgi:hypothetical protein
LDEERLLPVELGLELFLVQKLLFLNFKISGVLMEALTLWEENNPYEAIELIDF